MNMWKIWPSCTIPCHSMWPSTPHCMARTPGKRALGGLMVNGTMLSCAGCGYARAYMVPALQKQCDIYKEVKLDTLKDCPSLPSIGMCYGMHGSEDLFDTFGQEQAGLAELMNAATINFPSCSSNTWESASPPSAHLTVVLSCFPVRPWSALMQTHCSHGPAQDMPIRTCHVESELDYGLDAEAMYHNYGALPSNGWRMRQKSTGWRACCMQATGPRCDWTCATYPWMAIMRTLPRCSSS